MHNRTWRDPAETVAWVAATSDADPALFASRESGEFWGTLRRLGVSLLVTREYEHLLLALDAGGNNPDVSYLPMPHPSGLAVDLARGAVYVACTRNPNQVVALQPRGALVPISTAVLPGRFYLHDLAIIGGRLHANAVGLNAVIRLDCDGATTLAWWPRAVDSPEGPRTDRNYLQLNSIAAGATVDQSFFTASSERISTRRPGHLNYPVDGRGVVFSGATREPIARGLTRPHSARLHRGEVWLDNSGYGELTVIRGGRPTVACRLPGWTRGLCVIGDIAIVGTSRIIPRYRHYAPGLDPSHARCGLHAVHTHTGQVLGSLIWPNGNQIFGIEAVPAGFTTGLPFRQGRDRERRARATFYSFREPRRPTTADTTATLTSRGTP
ncbi:MAG: DUF4915 domain-containing protein [Chloroflexota bacterium]